MSNRVITVRLSEELHRRAKRATRHVTFNQHTEFSINKMAVAALTRSIEEIEATMTPEQLAAPLEPESLEQVA